VAILDDLRATRDETLSCFHLPESALARRYRPDKWDVRHILHHLADAETVLFDRIRRILSEPRQVLWAFDQNGWAAGLDYGALPLELSRDIFAATRNAVIHHATRHYLVRGHLEFVHSETGVRTLKDEFDKVASHNAHHLAQIRAALGQV
jgi:hypothetical protein